MEAREQTVTLTDVVIRSLAKDVQNFTNTNAKLNEVIARQGELIQELKKPIENDQEEKEALEPAGEVG